MKTFLALLLCAPLSTALAQCYQTNTVQTTNTTTTTVTTTNTTYGTTQQVVAVTCPGSNLWPRTFGGMGDDRGLSIATGEDGSVVVGGYFQGTNNFGGATFVSRSYSYINPNTVRDGFVAKYTAAGAHVWSKSIGGISNDQVNSVAVDENGDVLVAGQCANTIDFGDGNPTSGYGVGAFVVKLDGTDGHYLWHKRFDGDGADVGYGVTTDGSGSVYLIGSFCITVNFGGGLMTAAGTSGTSDMFLVKLTSGGSYLWAKRFGSVNGEAGYAITITSDNNPAMLCRYAGTVDFGGTSHTSDSSSSDTVVMKLSGLTGSTLWAKSFGGSGQDWGNAIASDGTDLYVTGYFETVCTFAGGPTLTASGRDAFIAKYSGTTGDAVWAKRIGGSATDTGNGVAIHNGNVLVAGFFAGVADFGGTSLTAAGSSDAFLASYSADGSLLSVIKYGGTLLDSMNGVAVEGGVTFSTGNFANTVNFDGTPKTSAGGNDGFIKRN